MKRTLGTVQPRDESVFKSRANDSHLSVIYNDTEGKKEQAMLLDGNLTKKVKVASHQFLFSGFSADDRTLYSSQVKEMGANVLDNWNDTCTHLVISSPSSTEKFLAACAKGIWYTSFKIRLIKPAYVQMCISKGQFGLEEQFEWFSDDSLLGRAARHWRLQPTRPFAGWSIMLRMDEAKKQSFRHILLAGGANIVESGTICIVDRTSSKMQMKEQKIDSSYVVDFILKCGHPVIDKYVCQ